MVVRRVRRTRPGARPRPATSCGARPRPRRARPLGGGPAAASARTARAAELGEEVRDRFGSNDATAARNFICSKIMCGESLRDMFANSSISTDSTRRCNDSSANGSASVMNPGLLPVADRRAAARAPSRASVPSSPSRCPRRTASPRRDDVRSRFEEGNDIVEIEDAACTARNRPRDCGSEAIGRGDDADGFLATQHTRVHAVLRRVVDHDADEPRAGSRITSRNRAAADVARRPLDDACARSTLPAPVPAR